VKQTQVIGTRYAEARLAPLTRHNPSCAIARRVGRPDRQRAG